MTYVDYLFVWWRHINVAKNVASVVVNLMECNNVWVVWSDYIGLAGVGQLCSWEMSQHERGREMGEDMPKGCRAREPNQQRGVPAAQSPCGMRLDHLATRVPLGSLFNSGGVHMHFSFRFCSIVAGLKFVRARCRLNRFRFSLLGIIFQFPLQLAVFLLQYVVLMLHFLQMQKDFGWSHGDLLRQFLYVVRLASIT